MKTPQDVLAHLESLGSAGRIADYFVDAGVRGRKGSNSSCPVAVHVGKVEPSASVGTDDVLWMNDDGTVREYIMLGPNVEQFVSDFDYGMFPDLEVDS